MSFQVPGVLAIVLVAIGLSVPAGNAGAGIVPTEEIAAQGAIEAQRDKVRRFMAREDVAESLVDLGVPADVARKRAEALSDEEVATIAGKLEQLPAGGALRHNETILLLLLIIVLLIAL